MLTTLIPMRHRIGVSWRGVVLGGQSSGGSQMLLQKTADMLTLQSSDKGGTGDLLIITSSAYTSTSTSSALPLSDLPDGNHDAKSFAIYSENTHTQQLSALQPGALTYVLCMVRYTYMVWYGTGTIPAIPWMPPNGIGTDILWVNESSATIHKKNHTGSKILH